VSGELLFGIHAVDAALTHDPGNVLELYIESDSHNARLKELSDRARDLGVKPHSRPREALDRMTGGARHQGAVARYRAPPPRAESELYELVEKAEKDTLLLVLDGVTDPHNLGACLRVANGAGAHAVLAPKDRAVGVTPTVSKVASGAAESTPYLMVTNLARMLSELKERNIWIVGADERAEKTLYEADLPESIAWVLGAEGEGMRRLTRESCDLLVRIPMRGEVESLNVSVSAGVCLYESARRRRAPA
jgi:23S rRNA (guanosine2251-2'-O)-methyltransferase